MSFPYIFLFSLSFLVFVRHHFDARELYIGPVSSRTGYGVSLLDFVTQQRPVSLSLSFLMYSGL